MQISDKDAFASIYGRLLNGQEPKEEEEELLYSIRCQNCTGRYE